MDPNTGRSRGFGFILFKDAASVEKVSWVLYNQKSVYSMRILFLDHDWLMCFAHGWVLWEKQRGWELLLSFLKGLKVEIKWRSEWAGVVQADYG